MVVQFREAETEYDVFLVSDYLYVVSFFFFFGFFV